MLFVFALFASLASAECQPFSARIDSSTPVIDCLKIAESRDCGAGLVVTNYCSGSVFLVENGRLVKPELLAPGSKDSPTSVNLTGPIEVIQEPFNLAETEEYGGIPKYECTYGNYLAILSPESFNASGRRLIGVLCQGGLRDGEEMKNWTVGLSVGGQTVLTSGRTVAGPPAATLPNFSLTGPLPAVLAFGALIIVLLLAIIKLSSRGGDDAPPNYEKTPPPEKPQSIEMPRISSSAEEPPNGFLGEIK
ncbi:hypothetical protein AUJ14_01555 [Candidatus Micrarchaeota archaeon CG1_02_55_22]|nr:MAG: hypothetical protein AUJ14_01555 [Candidatus Micrarchaeota archaeon CG1_02_55_22]